MDRHIELRYRMEQDEDGEETGEDVTRDDSWNYADVLWNGIQAKAVTAAFEQLSYKEQWYLEKRNAICMICGRVSPLSTQSTFEDLAVDFEGTTASGAKRFYRRHIRQATAEAAGKRCDPYRDTETNRYAKKEQKNSRRCLPVSGGQRRRLSSFPTKSNGIWKSGTPSA